MTHATISSIFAQPPICGNCGFSEEWIEYAEDIEKLRARHVAFSPQAASRDADETGDETALCAKCGSALVEVDDVAHCLWCDAAANAI